MKNIFKKIAAITTTAITSLSICLTSIPVSAYEYNSYYDTYRFYGELAPASGMQSMWIQTLHPRSINKYIHQGQSTSGNVEGTYRTYGSAGDDWVAVVDIFSTTSDVVNGGTLFRRTMYTNVAASNPQEIFTVNSMSAKNENGIEITPSPISMYVVKVGDINEDGNVDWSDVSVLNDYLMGNISLSDNPLRAADTNDDGYVSSADLNTLISYLSGNIEHF